MRVLFGEYKGRILKAPRGLSIRPTTSRMCDWICNVLMHEFRGSRVCDLFAGCGTLGIHALSLGAESCVFIDQSAKAHKLISNNLSQLGLLESNTILRKSVYSFLRNSGGIKSDLVFVDPPYEETDYGQLLVSIEESGLLKAGAFMIVEHPTGLDLPELKLDIWRQKTFGRSSIDIYRNEQK
jgi:16S rRNA (guanine966-N2)-methyltransferase